MRKGRVFLPSLSGYTKARTSGNALQGIPWQRGKTILELLQINYML